MPRICAFVLVALLLAGTTPVSAQSLEIHGSALALDVIEKTFMGFDAGASVVTPAGLSFGGDVSQVFARVSRSAVRGGGTSVKSFGVYTAQVTARLWPSRESRVQPYGVVGVGVATDPDISDKYTAITVGGGINAWLQPRVGLRGDFRRVFLPDNDGGGRLWSVGIVVRP